MDHRTLGRTGIQASLVGLGTGGANTFGQARGASQAEAAAVVRRALDLGISYFDTAAAYGASEIRLSSALAGIPRGSYVLASKYQPRAPDGSFRSGTDVDAALRGSLTRLGTDVIDVYQVHAPRVDDYDLVIAEHLPVLVRAREAGWIRAIGVTESFAGDDPHHEMLRRALRDDYFDLMMVGYNVLHQSAEREVLPLAASGNVAVVVMAAVRRALASRSRLESLVADLKASGDLAPDAVEDSDPLGWLIHGDTTSVQAACYRYVAEGPAVSVVLTGTFDPGHLTENVAAIDRGPLLPADRDRLRATFGHLDLGLGR